MVLQRKVILSLYNSLIKESKKWTAYNYRMYVLRKIRYEFQRNKLLEDVEQINACYKEGLMALDVIKRQVIMGKLYGTNPLVIETDKLQEKKADTQIT